MLFGNYSVAGPTMWNYTSAWETPLRLLFETLGCYAFAMGFAYLLYTLLDSDRRGGNVATRLLGCKLLRLQAPYTYAIYMFGPDFQLPVLAKIMDLSPQLTHSNVWTLSFYAMATWPGILLLAMLLHHIVERPCAWVYKSLRRCCGWRIESLRKHE